MPSITDVQPQSKKSSQNNNEKLTPSTVSLSQQHIISTSTINTTDLTNTDPIIQVILMLEKKQRNLCKRKEKLEVYDEEAKVGKELNRDQKEALSKYSEVLGQIECVKDISDQLKKIQTESIRNQKRLAKQAAEEKRLLVAQRLREYVQLRYFLDHRPSSLKSEESSLLDELARIIVPSDLSSNSITRSVDAILSIYQTGSLSSTIKNITGRSSRELREMLDHLLEQHEMLLSVNTIPMQQTKTLEANISTSMTEEISEAIPITLLSERETNEQQPSNNNIETSSLDQIESVHANVPEYPVQFDTRNQNIPLQQIIEDNTFISLDPISLKNCQDNFQIQSNESKLQTLTVLNTNLTDHNPSQELTRQMIQPTEINYEQETPSIINDDNSLPTDEPKIEEPWQQPRSSSGNTQRGTQFNENMNKTYRRRGRNSYGQHYRQGARDSYQDRSYNSGQIYYHENNDGKNEHQNILNPGYRSNRGNIYRSDNSGPHRRGYQQPSSFQPHIEQHRNAPSNQNK